MSRPRLIALLLALATLVVYLPVWRCDFLNYDDNVYVTDNAMVKKGLTGPGFARAFTLGYANNWHPLTWLSHMTDCQLFGVNPRAHHLVNALFHAANAALLFALLFRLTAKIWPSLLVAALFAWHPLHVESVAWVAERKDVLSTFFALWALLSYVQYVQEKRRSHYALALGFFLLALMAKPMVVTLPFVFLLLDFWPLNRIRNPESGAWHLKAPVLEKWPFFVLAVASCVLTYISQSVNYHGFMGVKSLTQVSMVERLKNVPVAYVTYLLKMFWPVNLAVFYPLEKIIPAGLAAGAALVLAIISAVAWRLRRDRPYLAVGWLWFLGSLVPVIGLVRVGDAALADRYTYLPVVGIFMMLAFGADEWVGQRRVRQKIAAVTAGLILVACVGLTERQLSFWRNSESLFRHSLAVTADNGLARNNLACDLQAQGRLAEALVEYRAAAALTPTDAMYQNNLANILDLTGQPAEALAGYRKAIQLAPGDPSQHTGAGYELGRLGQYDAALAEFADAEKLAPRYLAPHQQAAQVYFKMGRDADGLRELRAAIALAPENWQILTETAHYLAANDNAAMRDGPSAMKLAAKASLLTGGGVVQVCDVLGMACAETGDFTDAVDSVQHAIELTTAAKLTGVEPLQRRLELYQQHQPWHESFRGAGAGTNNTSIGAP